MKPTREPSSCHTDLVPGHNPRHFIAQKHLAFDGMCVIQQCSPFISISYHLYGSSSNNAKRIRKLPTSSVLHTIVGARCVAYAHIHTYESIKISFRYWIFPLPHSRHPGFLSCIEPAKVEHIERWKWMENALQPVSECGKLRFLIAISTTRSHTHSRRHFLFPATSTSYFAWKLLQCYSLAERSLPPVSHSQTNQISNM